MFSRMAATQVTFLEYRQRSGWGGPRKGAGPKPRRRRGIVHHVRRDRFERLAAGHVTLRVREGVPSLRDRRLVEELRRSFGQVCERGDFRLVHYSILNDHLHLIVEAENSHALACGMKAVGARVARAVKRVFGWRGPVMLGRYHLRVLKSFRQVRNALAYVLLNARRHAAKHARRAEASWRIDPASSGVSFDGWKGGAAGGASARCGTAGVARPRSYALTEGWRRHGLISPLETPG
jgi:REP element-mobilizing transposase RayT